MNFLIKKAKSHDQDAFVELMKENAKSMYRVAKAILKNDDDVADAMQETALLCWEKIETLRNDRMFRTWMIRILINECNTIYRKKKSVLLHNEISDQFVNETGFLNVEWRMLLDSLEVKFREVIILHYVEGMKVREIAKVLGVSQSTVKARLVQAREQVKKFYCEEWKGEL